MKEKYKKGRQRHKETAEELHNIEKKIAFVERKKKIQCARAKKNLSWKFYWKINTSRQGSMMMMMLLMTMATDVDNINRNIHTHHSAFYFCMTQILFFFVPSIQYEQNPFMSNNVRVFIRFYDFKQDFILFLQLFLCASAHFLWLSLSRYIIKILWWFYSDIRCEHLTVIR